MSAIRKAKPAKAILYVPDIGWSLN